MSASPFNPRLPAVSVAKGRRPTSADPAGPVRPAAPLAACVHRFAATPSAAGWARRHTTDVLERWGFES